MNCFAEVDQTNKIVRVIVADQPFIDSGASGRPANFIQTNPDTRGGSSSTAAPPLRGNYAGPGFTYDRGRDVFVPQQPFPSWLLNLQTNLWAAPTPMPADGKYYSWDEASKTWKAAAVVIGQGAL